MQNCIKTIIKETFSAGMVPLNTTQLRGSACPTMTIGNFWEISIVIDSDKGHCCEHLKKQLIIYDEN